MTKQIDSLTKLNNYLTNDWFKIKENKQQLLDFLLDLGGFKNLNDFLKTVSSKTAVVTLIAGVNSRWINSLKNSKDKSDVQNFDPEKPRALALVKNLIPGITRAEKIPIGIYNLYATIGLGKNIIVYRSHQKEIKKEIAKILGIKVIYKKQLIPKGVSKPLGHGDALIQISETIRPYRYLLTNFCSDANSKMTAIFSLLTLYILDKYGQKVSLILASTLMEKPKYPIYTDKDGLPVGIGHQKLQGNCQREENGLSNVGWRAYLAADLLTAMNHFKNEYQKSNSYAHLNNGNNELALDNFDEYLMKQRKARHLCVASPFEISNSAKTIEKIPQFLKMERLVLERDSLIFG